jgi:WD40 repeat protein
MRVLQAKTKRPLDVLAIGAGGHVAAASSAFEATGHVDVWEVASGKVVFTHAGARGNRQSLAFTPDGGHLFVGGEDAVEVFDTRSWAAQPAPPLELGRPSFVLSADGGRFLLTASENYTGTTACFEIEGGTRFRNQWSVGPDQYLLYGDPALSPDGARVAVSMHDGFRDHVRNVVQLRDADTGKVLRTIDFDLKGADPIQQIAFSADGAQVLVRALGRVVKVYDAATGQPAGELLHPGRPYVTGMAVHPNGQVACSRNNGTVCLWNLETRELVRTLDWKLGKLMSIAFAPDGSIGAAGTEDGQVVVWDVDE